MTNEYLLHSSITEIKIKIPKKIQKNQKKSKKNPLKTQIYLFLLHSRIFIIIIARIYIHRSSKCTSGRTTARSNDDNLRIRSGGLTSLAIGEFSPRLRR